MGKTENDSIKVYVRFRPVNDREKQEQTPYTVDINFLENNRRVELKPSTGALQEAKYNFDYIFDTNTTQVTASCKISHA